MFAVSRDQEKMRIKGKIISWNEDKGFGFIAPMASSKQVFIHITAFNNKRRIPKIGEVVTYTLSTDKQGRVCASEATYSGEKLKSADRNGRGSMSAPMALAFLAGVVVAVIFGLVPLIVMAVYGGLSLLTFLIYYSDKSAAKRDAWRTPESTLHVLALAGGWPGAIIAQQLLRHKSKKKSFKLVLWITVLMNIILLAWLLTEYGELVP